MATQEEIILKLQADVADAKKALEEVKKSVEGVGKASKETAKATGGIRQGLKGTGGALKIAGRSGGYALAGAAIGKAMNMAIASANRPKYPTTLQYQ